MKLYISSDLGTESSGNTVSKHELSAIESLGDKLIQIGNDHINPTKFGLPDNPFLRDYLTTDLLAKLDNRGKLIQDTVAFKGTIAMLYAGPFTNTIRYLKAKGIKTILTLDAHDRQESIKEFESLGFEYPYNHVKNDDLWRIYNGAAHEADIVIVPSMASAEFLKKEGVENTRIRIIPHGIDSPSTGVKIHSIPKPFNVGYLGAIGPDKGLKYLIEAWSQLNYHDSTLIIAGSNSKEFEPYIRRYATGGKYHLMGWVNDKIDFFSNIAVYVQPSVTEAFGIEVIEAMSYGRTVICSDGAGAVDAIENGKNGFVVKKRDVKELVHLIDHLKNVESNLTGIGTSARRTSENYSWDKIMEQYVRTYTSI